MKGVRHNPNLNVIAQSPRRNSGDRTGSCVRTGSWALRKFGITQKSMNFPRVRKYPRITELELL